MEAADAAIKKADEGEWWRLVAWQPDRQFWQVPSRTRPGQFYVVRRVRRDPQQRWWLSLSCDCPTSTVNRREICWHKAAVFLRHQHQQGAQRAPIFGSTHQEPAPTPTLQPLQSTYLPGDLPADSRPQQDPAAWPGQLRDQQPGAPPVLPGVPGGGVEDGGAGVPDALPPGQVDRSPRLVTVVQGRSLGEGSGSTFWRLIRDDGFELVPRLTLGAACESACEHMGANPIWNQS